MTIGLLGKKLGMTRIHDDTGTIIPVTVIEAGPCPILQVKSTGTDGYSALQLGFDPRPERGVIRLKVHVIVGAVALHRVRQRAATGR